MKGVLVIGPRVPIMQSLMPFLKTWFPEISREDVQQIICVRRNFRNAHIESYENEQMTLRN